MIWSCRMVLITSWSTCDLSSSSTWGISLSELNSRVVKAVCYRRLRNLIPRCFAPSHCSKLVKFINILSTKFLICQLMIHLKAAIISFKCGNNLYVHDWIMDVVLGESISTSTFSSSKPAIPWEGTLSRISRIFRPLHFGFWLKDCNNSLIQIPVIHALVFFRK